MLHLSDVPPLAPRSPRRAIATLVAWAACGVLATGAHAQVPVGGHFGLVLPLVAHADGETTDITDDFVIGFPVGITLKKWDRVAFDLELVPLVQDAPLSVDLTVHPGLLLPLGHSFTAGLRAAFEVEGDAWGLTPLVARSFPIHGGDTAYFLELDLPLRVREDDDGANDGSVGLAFHAGIAF